MTQLSQKISPLIALIVVTYGLQSIASIEWEENLDLIIKFQNTYITDTFTAFNTIFSIVIPAIACFLLFIHNFFIKPNFLNNISYLTFLSGAIALNSFLKIIFSELRPNLYSLIREKQMRICPCEQDYGMPPLYTFLIVCFYYLIRRRYFEKYSCGFELNSDMYRSSNTVNFTKPMKIEVEENKDVWFLAFRFLSLIYLIVFIFFRAMIGSSFLLQLIFGVLFGAVWGSIYFNYFHENLKTNLKLMINKNSADRSVIYQTVLVYLGTVLFCIIFVFLKTNLFEKTQIKRMNEILNKYCKDDYYLDFVDLHYLCAGFLPIFFLIFCRVFNMKKRMAIPPHVSFSDLNLIEKLLRLIIVLIPFAIIIGVELLFRLYFFKPTDTWLFLKLINLFFISVLLAFYLSVLQPYLLYKMNIVLQDEFVFPRFSHANVSSNNTDLLIGDIMNIKKVNHTDSFLNEIKEKKKKRDRVNSNYDDVQNCLNMSDGYLLNNPKRKYSIM